MRRLIITSCGIAGGLMLASLAAASPPVALQVDRGIASSGVHSADRLAPTRAGLMLRWAAVGKCVVGRDRSTSLALVRAPLGSDDASDAARRLDPIFAQCLAGSGVPGPSSAVLRRAAVAGALGIAVPRA